MGRVIEIVADEVAHAAVLCPSFYRAEVVQNPNRLDRFAEAVKRRLLGRAFGHAA